MKEEKVIAYIFERKIVKEDKDSISFAFIPVEVVIGTELSFNDLNGLKVLNTNSKLFGENKEFNLLNNEDTINDKYVYAFPCNIEGRKEKAIQRTIKTLNDEIASLEDRIVYQIYYKDENYTKEFFFNDKIEAAISIDASDPYSLYDIIYRDFDNVKTIADEIERKRERILVKSPIETEEENDGIIHSDDIFKKVSKTVICQDEQIMQIATAVAKNRLAKNPNIKSNMLVCGPTGCGKSEIFRCISSNFDIPISVEDSTEYTAASFKGKDVSEMLIHLYQNAEGDLEKAQLGILVIDEIDKKVSKNSETETYTSAVISSFLKMMEGHIFHIQNGKEQIAFDTSNLTFAFLGAFSGIEEHSRKRRTLGFVSDKDKEEMVDKTNIYNPETLKKYGLLPEFVGRNDSIVVLNSLDVKDLERIIRESDKSQLLLYKAFFEENGIDFIYDDATITAIAKKAHELGLGARSIKTIIEDSLKIANYFALSRKKYTTLQITPETIEDNKKYILK